jgi:uncharacterized membrane protein YebE (DUF533 family)
MWKHTRFFAAAMAFLMIASMAILPMPARASEEGKRNTAIGLGALTGVLFTMRGNKIPAFAGLAATAYAYKRYDDAVKARHRRERRARYYRLHHHKTHYSHR